MHPQLAITLKEQQPHLVAQAHTSGPPVPQHPQLPGQIQLPPSLQQQMEQQFQLGFGNQPFGNQPLLLPPNQGLAARPALPSLSDNAISQLGMWPQPKGLPPLSQQPQLPSLSNAGLSQQQQLPNLPSLGNAGLTLAGMGGIQPHLFGNGGAHSIQQQQSGNIAQGNRNSWPALPLANSHSTGPGVQGSSMPGLPQLPGLPPGLPGLPDLTGTGLLPVGGLQAGKQPSGLQLGQQMLPAGLQLGQQQGGLQLSSQQASAGGLQLSNQQPQGTGLQLGQQQAPTAGLQLGNQQPQVGALQPGTQPAGGGQPQPARHALNLGDGAPAGKSNSQLQLQNASSQQATGLHLNSGNGTGPGMWLNQSQGPHGMPGVAPPGVNTGSGTGMSSGSGISGSLNLGGAGGARSQQHHGHAGLQAGTGRPVTMGLDLGSEEAHKRSTTGNASHS
jgi:hypothetical protein